MESRHMSDATAISLLIGTFFLSFFASYYSAKIANDRMDEILVGVVKGVAVSRKHQTIMLYNQWFPMMSYPTGGSALVALANIQIGNSVNTEGVRYLAYVFAGPPGGERSCSCSLVAVP
jgi:hypothetical protein